MSGSSNIIIHVENSTEKQENIRNARKTLKVLQKTADKENLIGRDILSVKEKIFKSETLENIEHKRKKYISQSVQTDLEIKRITENDLTCESAPSENYWEALAEKRRAALEDTLKENEELHDKVNTLEDKLNTSNEFIITSTKYTSELKIKVSELEDELNTSRKMLDESRNLVEVLTELLQENEENASIAEEAAEEPIEESVEE